MQSTCSRVLSGCTGAHGRIALGRPVPARRRLASRRPPSQSIISCSLEGPTSSRKAAGRAQASAVFAELLPTVAADTELQQAYDAGFAVRSRHWRAFKRPGRVQNRRRDTRLPQLT